MILFVRDNSGVLFLVNVHTPLSGVQIDGLRIVFAEPGEFIPLSEGYSLTGESHIFSGVLDKEAVIQGRTVPVGTPVSLGLLELDIGGSILITATLSAVHIGDAILICPGWTKFDTELNINELVRSDILSGTCHLVPSIESSKGVVA